jgi:hypothetical protein
MAAPPIAPGRVLAFGALIELATGLALFALPGFVFTQLFGGSLPLESVPLARVTGIALMSLAAACWPERVSASIAAMNGMLAYNALVATYLAFVGIALGMGGMLLWPAVALHAVVAALLVWSRND